MPWPVGLLLGCGVRKEGVLIFWVNMVSKMIRLVSLIFD